MNWTGRFEDRAGDYVTPFNQTVQNAVDSIDICEPCGREKNAMKLWNFVFNNVEYELSKTWFTPEETIKNGKGDCEDVTFLMGSMMLAAGIKEPEIVVGYLHHKDGRKEEHTWNRVGDMVIDATGTPSVVRELRYEEVDSWDLKIEGQENETRKNTQST